MKISVYKQTLHANGSFQNVHGELIVTLNYYGKKINTTHGFANGDFSKTVYVHKVEAFVSNELWESKTFIANKDMLLNEAAHLKDRLQKHLEFLANSKPAVTFDEKMKQLGFK